MASEVRILHPPPSLAEAASYIGRSPLVDRREGEIRYAQFCYDFVMNYSVYILKCFDGKPYTGCTENIEERLKRHNNGYVPATKDRRPVELVTYIVFNNKYKAFEFEKYLKSGSGRAFINKHLA